ncbi:MAG: 3-carboxy-cis,cis-muconate cycloisomerase [bacterium]|nr:3-carboxy-cis,cis-muconate cycloisomerase [bacterium]
MLRDPLFTDAEIDLLFTDERFTRTLLHVEKVLARVEGAAGVIPPEAAHAIERTIDALTVDHERLRVGMRKDGVPTIDLVAQIREAVDTPHRAYVHYGATTQDIIDSALVLQVREALTVLETRLARVVERLAQLADHERYTLMAGRTHSQHAQPITFGFKAAGWLAPFLRHHVRLSELKPRLLVIQFGGAVGTLAALGQSGLVVRTALADALELGVPPIAWFTARDSLAEFGGWLSLVTGSAAKIAQDIILMAQSEVGELQESADGGGSSAMAHKHNPILSETIIAAARTNAGLLSALHGALIQEQERATGGWQTEWLTLPHMVGLTGAALRNLLELLKTMQINRTQMQANVTSTYGTMLSEAVEMALAAQMPRTEAKRLVRDASIIALAEKRHLVEVLKAATPVVLDHLREEAAYLGMAEQFIDQVLNEV